MSLSDVLRTGSSPLAISDPEIELQLPLADEPSPEVSIVIPAMNEEATIADFIAWCREGLTAAGVRGEILIIDSSSDTTPEIALSLGCRVLRTPRRGLGRAYIDATSFIRGGYVIMGDADCTYDFRNIQPFIEALRAGNDFAMGSRWRGTIEPGSMPALHRYVGTPVTTWILNRLYGSDFTDIHCGMRAITRESLMRMGLVSQSWEYASEMVLKSVRMNLSIAEVPVTFYKDREGRQSHHKRSGWTSPFKAAWINLRAMFVYGAEYFMLKPGVALLLLGLILVLPLAGGSITIGHLTFSLYWMLVGVTFAIIGLESFFFGCLAQVFCSYEADARERWTRVFPYTRTILASAGAFILGLGPVVALFVWYLEHHESLPRSDSSLDHMAVAGLLLMIGGFSTFCFTLLLHATSVRYGER